MKKPVILVFTTSYYPFVGGVEIAIQETARRLSGEFDFLIMTARQRKDLPKQEIRPEGIIVRIGFGNRMDKWILLLTAPFYYRGFASIVWGVDISQGALAAAILKFFMPQVPFVFTIQYGEENTRLKRGRFGAINLAFRYMLSRADSVTAISRALLEYAREYGYRGPAEVVHNGVDIHTFKNLTQKERTSPVESGRQNSKIIITTSRLVRKNGVDILIQAIDHARKKIPDIQCHIFGDGPEKQKLILQTANCKLQNHVKFFGAAPYEKLPYHLHEADLFVRPSRSEGMGNSFVEALAAGIPIIGTPVGGLRDIIEDGKTGFFCRPNDSLHCAEKIVWALEHPENAKETVRAGKAMAERYFSWDTIARSYRNIFIASARFKKIAIATPLFPPDIGGPATYSALLLKELPRFGVRPSIVNFGEVRHLPKGIRHVRYFLKVLRHVRDADIVFALDPVSVGFPSFLAAFLLHKKFVIKIVGDYALEQYQNKFPISNFQFSQSYGTLKSVDEFQHETYDVITEARRFIQRFVTKRAHRIIVPSNYLKIIVSQWGVDERKIKVVYNSFEMPSFSLSKEDARKKLGLQGTIFISAGRLVPWKGFDVIINCMPEIIKEIPDAKLIIIGDGPNKHYLASLISTRELQGRIIFTGKLSHYDLLTYMRAGDIFMLNTGYEGFSHTLLEAMSLGIPVVTTRVCGNPEIIDHMKNGLLAEYNNREEMKRAVFLMYHDAKLRDTIIARARKKAAEFGKERMMRETTTILTEAKPRYRGFASVKRSAL